MCLCEGNDCQDLIYLTLPFSSLSIIPFSPLLLSFSLSLSLSPQPRTNSSMSTSLASFNRTPSLSRTPLLPLSSPLLPLLPLPLPLPLLLLLSPLLSPPLPLTPPLLCPPPPLLSPPLLPPPRSHSHSVSTLIGSACVRTSVWCTDITRLCWGACYWPCNRPRPLIVGWRRCVCVCDRELERKSVRERL